MKGEANFRSETLEPNYRIIFPLNFFGAYSFQLMQRLYHCD